MMLYSLGSMDTTRAGMKKGRSRAKSHYLMWIAQSMDTFTSSLSVPLGFTESGAARKKSVRELQTLYLMSLSAKH